MRYLFALLVFVSAGPLLNLNFAQGQEREIESRDPKPNIVFVIADDCTFRDIGCYGGQAQTPNIDALAGRGLKFERCFQTAPMCSPTRHSIYTGLYPVKSGAYPNHTFAHDHVQSIVHFLQPAGYRVALSGKTHIGPRNVFPFEMLQSETDNKNPDMEKIGALFQECARDQTPFCLFACSNEPHGPWDKGDATVYPAEEITLPPYIVDTPEVRDSFSRYLAEITYFDSQVGQIVGLLEQHDLRDDTMLVVVSEQGNGFPFAKWTCYESGLQSAMLIDWPGRTRPGTTTPAMVEYVDITPTLIEAAGIAADSRLDGVSFLPVIEGQTDKHKEFVFGLMTTRGIIHGSDAYAIRSIRDEEFKLIWNINYENRFDNVCVKSAFYQSMIRKAESGDEKAQHLVNAYHNRPEFELFKLTSDPLEMTNVAADPDNEAVMRRLKSKLDEWMSAQGDQGATTEYEALLRQSKFRNLTLEEAEQRWKENDRARR